MDINDCAGIDLYADDGDATFVDDYKDNIDIYDDVVSIPTLTAGTSSPAAESPNPKLRVSPADNRDGHEETSHISEVVGRRHQLYVGNLTWWTKDQDVADAILEIGVKDCVEVKFFENRINGQSKGYCVISLKTEQSARICLDKLPLKELYGRKPLVTNPTKQALNLFESNSKTRPMNQTNAGRHSYNMGPPLYGPIPRYIAPPMIAPPIIQQTIPIGNAHMMPPPPVLFPPRIPSNIRPIFSTSPHVDVRCPRPDWSCRLSRYPHYSPYSSTQSTYHYSDQTRAVPPSMSKQYAVRSEIRAASLNQPAVPGSSANHSPSTSQHSPNTDSPESYGQLLMTSDWAEAHKLYENNDESSYADTIFEKILSNNRKISSTAIARAVSDTASGDYRSAVDTLSTALSLIRQSHAADDDRCKILMSSLQDTLSSVEAKAYGSQRSRSRDRRYDTRESPERRSRRHTRERSYCESSRRLDYYRDDYEERPRKRNRFGSDDVEDRPSSFVYNPNKRGSHQDYTRKDDRDGDRKYHERERSVRRSRQ